MTSYPRELAELQREVAEAREEIAQIKADFERRMAKYVGLPVPPAPTFATYQQKLAYELGQQHNEPVVALTEREPSVANLMDAFAILSLQNGPLGESGKDIDVFIEVDRAVIGEIDTLIRDSRESEDPTFILRPYLRPTVIRYMEGGDIAIHVSSIDHIDSYKP